MNLVKSHTVTWADIISPTHKDIHSLVKNFGVPVTAANQLKEPTLRPMASEVGKFLYVILHFPVFNKEKQTSESAEVDFIITPNMLFTVRYQQIEPLESLLRKCSSVPIKNAEHCLGRGPLFLFYYIVKSLSEFSLRELDHIHEKINLVEEEIFSGREKEVVPKISLIRRDIINFSGIIKPQLAALENLFNLNDSLDSFAKPLIEELITEYRKIADLVQTKKEMIEALHATNESLLNIKTNDIMKTLTIMAFVTFPLMLFSSLFGMNTSKLPIVGNPNDFWIIVGVMVAATIGFFAFFKTRKWL